MFLWYLAYNMVAPLTGYSGIVHEWRRIKKSYLRLCTSDLSPSPDTMRGRRPARCGVIIGSRYAEDVVRGSFT